MNANRAAPYDWPVVYGLHGLHGHEHYRERGRSAASQTKAVEIILWSYLAKWQAARQDA